MRYCSKCGSDQIDFKVPADDNLKRYVCSACDSIFYTNPNLIVGTVCIKDEYVLLCKRNIEPRFGRWTLPAGFMENAETLQEGALRETKEETQAAPKIISPSPANCRSCTVWGARRCVKDTVQIYSNQWKSGILDEWVGFRGEDLKLIHI